MFHFLPISLSFILFGSINKDIIWLRTLMFFGSIVFLLYAFFELTTDIIPVIILNTTPNRSCASPFGLVL